MFAEGGNSFFFHNFPMRSSFGNGNYNTDTHFYLVMPLTIVWKFGSLYVQFLGWVGGVYTHN